MLVGRKMRFRHRILITNVYLSINLKVPILQSKIRRDFEIVI